MAVKEVKAKRDLVEYLTERELATYDEAWRVVSDFEQEYNAFIIKRKKIKSAGFLWRLTIIPLFFFIAVWFVLCPIIYIVKGNAIVPNFVHRWTDKLLKE